MIRRQRLVHFHFVLKVFDLYSTVQYANYAILHGDRHTMKPDDGNPKFGRLLIILLLVVLFCGVLTWFAEKYLG